LNHSKTQSAARLFALALALFIAINLVLACRHQGFDGNLWWIDLRAAPFWLRQIWLAMLSLLLLVWAIKPVVSPWQRNVTCAAVVVTGVVAAFNSIQFFALVHRASIGPGVPLPWSMFVTIGVAWLALEVWRAPLARPRMRGFAVATGLAMAAVCLALGQMFFFGKTDYRRHADAAVVLGARVYRDGRASDALADRVRTACDLYRAGLVPCLVMSGGPGDGRTHETQAMRDMAISLGVPADAILLDPQGVSTEATARNTAELLRARGIDRVLAVSHFYHLPRVKFLFKRHGLDVFTVPAKESYLLTAMPKFIAREVAAIWWHWL